MNVGYHPAVQKDVNRILRRYDLASSRLGDTSLNWHQASYLEYAVHRCRHIHLWKLVQQPTGQWTILK